MDFRRMDLDGYLKVAVSEVDVAMDGFLPTLDESPGSIHEAMRYCIFAGGKRLRPVLCIAAAKMQ